MFNKNKCERDFRRVKMNAKAEVDESIDVEQGDLFLCDILTWPVKDDLASMEIPLFSISKNKDLELRIYNHGNKSISVRPSTDGAATMFDKDLFVYINSQVISALNAGKPVSKTVKINSTEFLKATHRGDGGNSYQRILDMLRRLRGTTIETNIETGGIRQTEGFSLIDNYKITKAKKKNRKRPSQNGTEIEIYEVQEVHEFSVTLSDWSYNGLLKFEALTLNKEYFKLTRAFDRRIYELARKYCGDKSIFKMNIDLVSAKIGIKAERFRTREHLRQTIKDNQLPDYKIALDTKSDPDMVVFYTRDSHRLSKDLIKTDSIVWFESLERS